MEETEIGSVVATWLGEETEVGSVVTVWLEEGAEVGFAAGFVAMLGRVDEVLKRKLP